MCFHWIVLRMQFSIPSSPASDVPCCKRVKCSQTTGIMLLCSVLMPGKWRISTTGIQLLKPRSFSPSVQNKEFQHYPSSSYQEQGLCDVQGSSGNGTFPFFCWNHDLIHNCSPKIKRVIAPSLATVLLNQRESPPQQVPCRMAHFTHLAIIERSAPFCSEIPALTSNNLGQSCAEMVSLTSGALGSSWIQ